MRSSMAEEVLKEVYDIDRYFSISFFDLLHLELYCTRLCKSYCAQVKKYEHLNFTSTSTWYYTYDFDFRQKSVIEMVCIFVYSPSRRSEKFFFKYQYRIPVRKLAIKIYYCNDQHSRSSIPIWCVAVVKPTTAPIQCIWLQCAIVAAGKTK
jgi:hypothetical protein